MEFRYKSNYVEISYLDFEKKGMNRKLLAMIICYIYEIVQCDYFVN